jgi:hypothetical protein
VASLLSPCTYRFQPIFEEVAKLLRKDVQAAESLKVVRNYATIFHHGNEISDEGIMTGLNWTPFRIIRNCLTRIARDGQTDELLLSVLENPYF